MFRDESTLAMTPRLWPAIEKALRDSRFFILMADPPSAQSEWVQKEVACWLETERAENMLIVWTGGNIVWDQAKNDFDWNRTTSLPPIKIKKAGFQVFLSKRAWPPPNTSVLPGEAL